nr:unnamed protein product [Callosobruchus chinensis]
MSKEAAFPDNFSFRISTSLLFSSKLLVTLSSLLKGFVSQEVPSRETRGDQGEEVHWHPPGQKNITPPGPEVNPKDNPEKIQRLGDFNYRNAQRVIIRTLER